MSFKVSLVAILVVLVDFSLKKGDFLTLLIQNHPSTFLSTYY